MSTATWGELEPHTTGEKCPLSLLKKLLQEMIRQFGATGGCIALYDESVSQMVIRLHMRLRSAVPSLTGSNSVSTDTPSYRQRVTVDLANPSSSALGRVKRLSQPLETDPVLSLDKSSLFPVGTAYPYGQDLIGYTWRKNEPLIMRHEDYLLSFQPVDQVSFPPDITPGWYLSAPITVPELAFDAHYRRQPSKVLGIIVLYQAG